MTVDLENLVDLKRRAIKIRRMTLEEIANLGVGHIGGCMSVVEILVHLYYKTMNVDPDNPGDSKRDKFVMSKGHAGPALYAVLADMGFFPESWLGTLNRGGTNLPSHCDMNRTPGIDMTTGSLGQGLSAAVGIALGHRMRDLPGRVFALLSDGDLNEGQTWEAAMSASMYGLTDLTAFVDYNRMQIDGASIDVMNIANQVDRWTSFGWYSQEVDGHDFTAIGSAIDSALSQHDRPSMIILNTIKGKGMPFCEGDYTNHNMLVSQENRHEGLASLQKEEEALR
ncbi:MAG: transketolase [Spirochaetaceae bacterium]|nr:transketolase [Spirochaetaceae bacterium]